MFKAFQYSPNGCGNWAARASLLAILALASASAPAEGAEQCGPILQGLTARSPQTLRVRKVLKANLHWGGDRHLFFRKGADWSDIRAAHASLGDDDIPVLVGLVVRGELTDSMRGITFGVLKIFGAKALPCIEAGLATGTPGASDLSAIKINIETGLRSPPSPP